jgi:hypothetical protein
LKQPLSFDGVQQCHAWFGRDFRRYVPGLYWLNYFEAGYLRERGVDLQEIILVLPGKLTNLQNGIVLQLYEKPSDWQQYSSQVDDVLSRANGFFSRRRVVLPPVTTLREVFDVSAQIDKQWP